MLLLGQIAAGCQATEGIKRSEGADYGVSPLRQPTTGQAIKAVVAARRAKRAEEVVGQRQSAPPVPAHLFAARLNAMPAQNRAASRHDATMVQSLREGGYVFNPDNYVVATGNR